jgi:RNA polymerase sigma-70 factor (ECF subfamily)
MHWFPVNVSMSQSSNSTRRLLEQARAGSSESLGQLLRSYFRYLNSLSRGHIDDRIKMRVSASDVVQETLLEAHRDFAQFVGTSLEEFTGWLRKILFNNLSSAIEAHVLAAKRDVRKQRSLDEKNDASQSFGQLERTLAADVSSPSSPARRGESLAQLSQAIKELPEAYRQVIELRHFEGLSFSEIALRLGRNPGATRMLWVRAVEKLRLHLPNEI